MIYIENIMTSTAKSADYLGNVGVKWFNAAKGYGFIQPEGGGQDVFVHVTAVQEAGLTGLEDNQKIEFELVDGRDGRKSAGELKLSS